MVRKIGRFKYIASVIRTARLKFPNLTQEKLSEIIGYQNAQFISNVERGLCTIPPKRIKTLCLTLNIPECEVINAMIGDFENNLRSKL